MEKKSSISPEVARTMLWRQGVLHWYLRPVQQDLYDAYNKCTDKIIVFSCARRLGKSSTLCVIALELCLQKPNTFVKYCCAKQKDARGIIRPIIRQVLETCPADIRPEFKTQDNAWVFPNGSRIDVNGLDSGRAESIRGGSAHLIIIDEAGFVDDLPYIVGSILLPTTTTTKGKIILSSTPPKAPNHPYVTRYLNKARIQGNLVEKTIDDNPYIDPIELEKLIDEYGGRDSVEFRREMGCEIIKDDNFAIIPEFNNTAKKNLVKDWPRSVFYDAYVSMDVGMNDLTVVLFAWWDFLNAKLIIEDELTINGQKMNTTNLAEGIKKKEYDTYTDKLTGETKIPYLRISDNNLIVIKDLYDLYGLNFLPTKKDDKLAAINNVRVMIQNEEIIINPRCKTLISHLENGMWDKSKRSFERTEDTAHADAIDSLVYLCRNVQRTKNPYPAHYNRKSTENLFVKDPTNISSNQNNYKKIFNVK